MALGEVHPLLGAAFESGSVPTGVGVHLPGHVAELDLEGGFVGVDVHRELGLQQVLMHLPVHLGLKIDPAGIGVEVDLLADGAVEDLVDLLGGIDVELTGNEAAIVGIGSYAGTYTLNGKQALSYSRIRKLDSDFTRMERQNYVIQAVMNKLKNQDILTIMNIVNEMLPSINTNLTVNEIKDYITSLLSYDLGNIEQYKEPSGEYNDIQTCPGLGGYIVRSYSGMVENLHKNIYKVDSYEVSQRVKDNEERIYSTYGEFTKE